MQSEIYGVMEASTKISKERMGGQAMYDKEAASERVRHEDVRVKSKLQWRP
jgi:hypothetical protein